MNKEEFVQTSDHSIDATAFRAKLISWGELYFRPFPWRATNDPYQILMAEVMLHRTQASQVVPVYEQFIARYPTLAALENASREEIHAILYSLGLRWRINLVLEMVQILMERHDGHISQDKSELLALPGVSDYVASAVRCFGWGYPDALVDTNTVRVVGRLFGLKIKDSSRRSPLFRSLITRLVAPAAPVSYNYALLDLAALICTKIRRPACEKCPVWSFCMYGK